MAAVNDATNNVTSSTIVNNANAFSSSTADAINQFTTYLIVGVTLFVVVVMIIGLIVFLKMRKNRRKTIDEMLTDYSGLDRRDSIDYIKMDDIKNDMLITDGGTRFVGVIRAVGYDFYNAHIAEKVSTQSGYRGFINTITTPITYRQYDKVVDMTFVKEKYQKAYDKVTEKLFFTNEDYTQLKKQVDEIKKNAGDEIYEDTNFAIMVDELTSLQKKIQVLSWRQFHLEDEIVYINQISGEQSEPETVETYVFDWIYRPLDFSVDLTPQQVIERAEKELNAKASTMINSLASSGVKAYRCYSEELIDAYRRVFHPVTADEVSTRELLSKDDYFKDIISTTRANDLMNELQYEIAQEIAITAVNNLTVRTSEEIDEVVRKGYEKAVEELNSLPEAE